jgi:WD40 repeat protein
VLTGYGSPGESVDFSPKGRLLASVSEDSTVQLWNTQTGRCLRTIPLEGSKRFIRFHSITLSPDGTMLASWADHLNTVKLWNTKTGKLIRELTGYSGRIDWVRFSPNNKMLATSMDSESVRLWETQTGKCLLTLTLERSRETSIISSPDSKLLAFERIDDGDTVKLWNVQTGKCLLMVEGCGPRYWFVFSIDGTMLAIQGNEDGTVKLWRIE